MLHAKYFADLIFLIAVDQFVFESWIFVNHAILKSQLSDKVNAER